MIVDRSVLVLPDMRRTHSCATTKACWKCWVLDPFQRFQKLEARTFSKHCIHMPGRLCVQGKPYHCAFAAHVAQDYEVESRDGWRALGAFRFRKSGSRATARAIAWQFSIVHLVHLRQIPSAAPTNPLTSFDHRSGGSCSCPPSRFRKTHAAVPRWWGHPNYVLRRWGCAYMLSLVSLRQDLVQACLIRNYTRGTRRAAYSGLL